MSANNMLSREENNSPFILQPYPPYPDAVDELCGHGGMVCGVEPVEMHPLHLEQHLFTLHKHTQTQHMIHGRMNSSVNRVVFLKEFRDYLASANTQKHVSPHAPKYCQGKQHYTLSPNLETHPGFHYTYIQFQCR